MKNPAGIYLHIPFCKQACSYCDFYFTTQLSSRVVTVQSMMREIEIRAAEINEHTLQSIYFGGGTPSLLHADEIILLLEKIHHTFGVQPGAEITLEANPDDIDAEKITQWKKAGINRLSIGLQSLNDAELREMNRAHTAEMAIQSVQVAQQGGIENISVDLIYGTPWKTNTAWENEIQSVIDLQVPHVSAYQLTIEKKTRLAQAVREKQVIPAEDENVAVQYRMLIDNLRAAGITQYEVSNFSKPGREAIHNSAYWKGVPYLGIGPSAHSYRENTRRWNVSNLHLYAKALESGRKWWEEEILTERDLYNEFILTRLRTRQGFATQEINNFSPAVRSHFMETAEQLHLDHKLHMDEKRVFIPESALMLTDNICSALFLTD